MYIIKLTLYHIPSEISEKDNIFDSNFKFYIWYLHIDYRRKNAIFNLVKIVFIILYMRLAHINHCNILLCLSQKEAYISISHCYINDHEILFLLI